MRSPGVWLMGLVLLACVGAASAQTGPAHAALPQTGKVVLIDVDGDIGPATADQVRRGLALADKEGAQLVVLHLETTGGLDASTRRIVQDVRASRVPVAAFVAARETPSEASPVATVAPNAATSQILQAAHLASSGLPAVNDVSDLLRQLNGREVRVGERTVRLATQGVEVLVFEDDWRALFLSIVTEPGVALGLLIVGIFGLLLAFFNPGFPLPGVAGALALMLALFGLQMLPVDYRGLALVLLCPVLLTVAAFVRWSVPFVALGVAALVAGSMLLVRNGTPGFGVPLWVTAALALLAIAFGIGLVRLAARARRVPPVPGVSALVGLTGELVAFSDGEGWAHIQGDYWHVEGDPALLPGGRVRVMRVQGRGLQVAADAASEGVALSSASPSPTVPNAH